MQEIKNLNISEKDKICFEELKIPKTIAEIAVILDTTYNYAFTKVKVWEARGWVKRIQSKRAVKYYLNGDELQ